MYPSVSLFCHPDKTYGIPSQTFGSSQIHTFYGYVIFHSLDVPQSIQFGTTVNINNQFNKYLCMLLFVSLSLETSLFFYI